jgi:hypothetical protein
MEPGSSCSRQCAVRHVSLALALPAHLALTHFARRILALPLLQQSSLALQHPFAPARCAAEPTALASADSARPPLLPEQIECGSARHASHAVHRLERALACAEHFPVLPLLADRCTPCCVATARALPFRPCSASVDAPAGGTVQCVAIGRTLVATAVALPSSSCLVRRRRCCGRSSSGARAGSHFRCSPHPLLAIMTAATSLGAC